MPNRTKNRPHAAAEMKRRPRLRLAGRASGPLTTDPDNDAIDTADRTGDSAVQTIDSMSRRIDILAREFNVLGYFDDDDPHRPRAA